MKIIAWIIFSDIGMKTSLDTALAMRVIASTIWALSCLYSIPELVSSYVKRTLMHSLKNGSNFSLMATILDASAVTAFSF